MSSNLSIIFLIVILIVILSDLIHGLEQKKGRYVDARHPVLDFQAESLFELTADLSQMARNGNKTKKVPQSQSITQSVQTFKEDGDWFYDKDQKLPECSTKDSASRRGVCRYNHRPESPCCNGICCQRGDYCLFGFCKHINALSAAKDGRLLDYLDDPRQHDYDVLPSHEDEIFWDFYHDLADWKILLSDNNQHVIKWNLDYNIYKHDCSKYHPSQSVCRYNFRPDNECCNGKCCKRYEECISGKCVKTKYPDFQKSDQRESDEASVYMIYANRCELPKLYFTRNRNLTLYSYTPDNNLYRYNPATCPIFSRGKYET